MTKSECPLCGRHKTAKARVCKNCYKIGQLTYKSLRSEDSTKKGRELISRDTTSHLPSMGKVMIKRRKPRRRRVGESLEAFTQRQMRYVDRVVGDLVKPKTRKRPNTSG